ncbi:TIGR03757 family integrating conjugative element protein [Parahaliea mediterranea]|uniref:TIGR03757 family integrating conjugative element protein n=1 Tax=Parahaliea mediterranea TaxID=651086 RepID=UPI001F4ECF57|nr:TIGR03757 family integrating conjugative element protein [Parahaliea mediterranea]
MNARKPLRLLSTFFVVLCYQSIEASEIPGSIEVFIDSFHPVQSDADATSVYVIDRIDRLQQELSNDLPADPEIAKQMTLRHLQRMGVGLSGELENAATGLVKAMQYGLDRYPAIVFDGKFVVYGMTDLVAAIQLYQEWRAGERCP